MNDFKPPSPVQGMWATYIKNRAPNFKVHSSKANAYKAVLSTYSYIPRGGIVYNLVDNEWVEYENIVPNFICPVCGLECKRGDRVINSQVKDKRHVRIGHKPCVMTEQYQIQSSWKLRPDILTFLSEEEKQDPYLLRAYSHES